MKNWPLGLACVLGVAISLLSSCSSKSDPKPVTPARTYISVNVSEGGGTSYSLQQAYIESATFDSKVNSLSIVGKLANGKPITLAFDRLPSSGLPAYTTDQFTATLDGTVGTSASGTSSYNVQNRTVTGTFNATFPSTGVISGRFVDVATE